MNEDEKSVVTVGHRQGMSAAALAMAAATMGAGMGLSMPSIRTPRETRDYQRPGGVYNTEREQARRVRQMRRDAANSKGDV